ncbi:MAG: primosomal replication protein N [Candidatus Malihini olakiniferum]
MVTVNRLELSGIVYKAPIQKVSPSGIPHCQFVLEHRSVQKEAGLSRQARCLMPVIISGCKLKTINITFGVHIRVQGFICSHQSRNKLNKNVLHAEQIELTDFGE